MKKVTRIILAIAIASTAGLGALPASATQCTPKGCSGGCKVNRPDDSNIDLRTGTITLEKPIECYA